MSSVAISATALVPVGALQDNHGRISVTHIIGFSIAGTVFLVLILWFAIHCYRKRRQHQLGIAPLSVHDELTHCEKSSSCVIVLINETHLKLVFRQIPVFSRNNLSSQVVFPVKAHMKPSSEQFGAGRHYIPHHLLPDNTPKAFSPAVLTLPSPALVLDSEWSAAARKSYASSRLSLFSVFSAESPATEAFSSTTPRGGFGRSIRKVSQVFNPVLPDELSITLDESLIILKSFDDGWCVVGREGRILTPQPRGLLGHDGIGPTSAETVDLGMVPAWCFLKSVQGIRAERPERSSSLSVTVPMN